MNERIKELAEQAFDTANDGSINDIKIPKEFIEKFAELIIADCLKMCKKIWINVNLDATILIRTTAVGTPDYNRGRMDCHDNIKEHFGVE